MKRYVIFDLDGTLANVEHRRHLAEAKQWHEYNIRCNLDRAYPAMIDRARALSRDYLLWIVTGRPAELEHRTRDWLWVHGLVPDHMLMRPLGNRRRNVDLKHDWLASGRIPAAEVLCAYEDHEAVAALYRDHGITTHLVREGQVVESTASR